MSSKFTKISDYEYMSDMMTRLMVDIKSVGFTQGPYGRNYFLESEYGSPLITKDGYTVIKHMNFEDELTKPLLKFVQNNVSKTNDEAGDGTTYCATVMADAFLSLNKLRISGTNILDIQAGYDFIVPKIHSMLDKIAKKIDIKSNEIEQVATISANDDPIVGRTIAEAMKLVGAEGVITVEESKSSESISYEHKSGMHIDRGFVSPYFATNNEKMICEMEDPYILITNKKISNISSILKLLETSAKEGRPLFIIAEDIDGEALSTLIINRLRGIIKVCAIKAPGFGEKRAEMLKDIAILTNGQVICDETGDKLEDIVADSMINDKPVLGSCKRITVSKDNTIIVSGAGLSEDVNSRISFIKNQINETTSEYDKEKLQERLAKLSGGVAVIKVGGHTEAQVKELKDRVEDALNATRAAVSEGIIPGGGVTQLAISYILHDTVKENKSLSHDAKLVANKILESFSSSVHRIIDNTGKSAKVVISKLHEHFHDQKLSESNFKIDKVYNALTHEYVNPYEAGIIDPKKVIKIAFTNAINAIYMILRCEGAIYHKLEEKSSSISPSMPSMGGMDAMY
jgi:chaperonin GroEL